MVASRYQPQQKALLRVSLRTKTKGIATQLSRLLSVHFNSIIQEHVGCPEKLSDALDTLRIWCKLLFAAPLLSRVKP